MRTACRWRLGSPVWPSGEITWRIGGRAPDKKAAAAVTDTFKQVVKGGELRMHPIEGRLVERDVLEKLRAKK